MRSAGLAAESTACTYLELRGLRNVERNYNCRMGELDLIMQDQDTLAIIEVKARAAGATVSASESVTPQKQRRIIAATKHWLSHNPRWHDHPLRFDVLAMDGEQIAWIRNAFDAV